MHKQLFLIPVLLLLFGCQPDPVLQDSPPQPSSTATSHSTPSPSPVPMRYVFPVAGKASYEHTHHGYSATDIFAACGTAYVSPVDGVVLESDKVDRWDSKLDLGSTRGGLNISILGDDGVRYYGAHFSSIESFVKPQARVTAGQKLAVVGRTGDTTVCHVHFGISPVCMRLGDWWIRRGSIWPWPYLDSWRSQTASSPLQEITAWQAANGCPAKATVEP